jgi:hypothetical protein
MHLRRILGAIALAALVGIPLAAWAFYKPVRLLAPSLGGVSCISEVICVDSPSRAAEARTLYDDAREFVQGKLGPMHTQARVVFCASEACAQSFGLGRSTAKTLGPLGTVFGPRAWQPYYVRHELIHQAQYERLGAYRVLRSPDWFIEGMAYSLSEDPRTTLAEPFQRYRSKFDGWLRAVGKDNLWEQARNL